MNIKKYIILALIPFSFDLKGQVGIGTDTPSNSAMLEVQSNSKGLLTPRLTLSQRNSITAPSNGLLIYQTDGLTGFYVYSGSSWTRLSQESFGDIKSGVQAADHNGWILLDGRALSTLSASQQAAAVALGFSGNLPNATNAYLVQNGASMGSVSGSNTTTLTQANLPNVTFSGSAASAGAHAHTVDPAALNSGADGAHAHTSPDQYVYTTWYTHNHGVGDGSNPYNNVNSNVPGLVRKTLGGEALTACCIDNVFSGEEPDLRNSPKVIPNDSHQHGVYIPSTTSSTAAAHTHNIDIPSTNSSTDGAHSHTVSVASGGTASPINIAPRSLTVNMFIYLGN
jgi:hypothetical protein